MTKRELRLRALKDGVTAGRLRSAAQGESFL